MVFRIVITAINFRICYYLKKKPLCLLKIIPISSHPISPRGFPLSVSGYFPLRTFHTNRIKQKVVFCDWLLSMFSRFNHLQHLLVLGSFFFFPLRCNSHIIDLTLLKYTIQQLFFIFKKSCNHHRYLIPDIFVTQKELPYPLAVSPHFPLSLDSGNKEPTYSVDLCILDNSNQWSQKICGLFLLEILFSKFIHVIA